MLDFELQGLIVVADDQHINLEILKQHAKALGIEEKTRYCINGQEVIDTVERIVTESLIGLDRMQPLKLRPVSVILLDF
jgi:CheY-like chemotaxis protein